MMRHIQIVDLDGCISDDRHRRHLIDPELARCHDPAQHAARTAMFHAYHSKCFQDPVVNADQVMEQYAVFLTGRPVRYYAQTMMWLREVAYIRPLHIIMRNNHDHTPSVDLKRRMVKSLLDVNAYGVKLEELTLAIDDRADIVEMYRTEYGLNARVVRIGEEEHVHG